MFLLISWFAFFCTIQDKKKSASFLAGICSLIKNQGIVTAIIIALMNSNITKDKKILTFFYSGLISFSIFIFWPLYQYIKVGDPFAFIHVQKYWQHAHGFIDYLWTYLYNFRYVIQLINGLKSFRCILFYIGIIISINLIFHAKRFIIINGIKINCSFYFGVYILICSALLPAQGYLENTLRFHLILFPLWFIIGDYVYNFIYSIKSKALFKLLLLLFIFLLSSINLWATYIYGINKWAY